MCAIGGCCNVQPSSLGLVSSVFLSSLLATMALVRVAAQAVLVYVGRLVVVLGILYVALLSPYDG